MLCQAWGRRVSSSENYVPWQSYLGPFKNVLIYPILANTQSVGSQFSFITVPPWKATMSLTSYFSIHPASNMRASREKRQKWNIYFVYSARSTMKTSAHGKLEQQKMSFVDINLWELYIGILEGNTHRSSWYQSTDNVLQDAGQPQPLLQTAVSRVFLLQYYDAAQTAVRKSIKAYAPQHKSKDLSKCKSVARMEESRKYSYSLLN